MSNAHHIVWEDADMASYAADSTVVNGYLVTVCIDDEGPYRPAYYWDVTRDEEIFANGWHGSVPLAKKAAVAAAKALTSTQEGTTINS